MINLANKEIYCNHCRNGAVEFEIHTIEKTDSNGVPLIPRLRQEIYCCQCGKSNTVVLIKKNQIDPSPALPPNPMLPEITNKVIEIDEKEIEKNRREPLNLTDALRNPTLINEKKSINLIGF